MASTNASSGSDASSGSPVGAVAGFLLGAYIGGAIGIAAFGTAIPGTLPLGILGAWLGYRRGAHAISVVEQMSARGPSALKADIKRALNRILDVAFPDPPTAETNHRPEPPDDDIVIRLLAFQLALAGSEHGIIGFSGRASSDWSIGYVWGFKAAFIEWNGGSDDVKSLSSMTMLFLTLYGNKLGPELCGRALRLQEEQHPTRAREKHPFTDGLISGWRDAMDWLDTQGGKAPGRWFLYLNRQ